MGNTPSTAAHTALKFAQSLKLEATVSGFGSQYLQVDDYTIRFSDHAEHKNGGHHIEHGRMGESDLSVDPKSGNTLADAKVFIQKIRSALDAYETAEAAGDSVRGCWEAYSTIIPL